MMRYLSVCSGIEAASVAWHGLGWEPVAFSEIDPFASAVLAARFPNVLNLGTMEAYRDWPIERGAVDILVGGTPCQSFSVAGLRKGLDDPRGNLALVYLGILERFRPRWCVWENVPGVLSSNGGRDFGSFLGGLAQLGYGFAYRVLDAQYTRVDTHPRAVPQRRRRVFVVGHSGGDWRSAAAVLLEPDGVRGDPPTRRTSREGVAGGPAAGARDGGIADVSPCVVAKWSKGTGVPAGDEAQNLVPASYGIRSDAVRGDPPTRRTSREGVAGGPAAGARDGGVADIAFSFDPGQSHNPKATHQFCVEHTAPLIKERVHAVGRGTLIGPHPAVIGFHHNAQACQLPTDARDTSISDSLTTSQNAAVALFSPQVIGFQSNLGSQGGDVFTNVSPPVRIGGVATLHAPTMAVRRLTPRECERLQGFPDEWTAITYRGKPAADGPRYKALGNSMAVNVMRWLGQRIASHASRNA